MQTASPRLEGVRRQLGEPAGWGSAGERLIDVGHTYGDGDAVAIHVRKRAHRYDLDDGGDAVRKALALGASERWLTVADGIVADEGFNVNRRGVVFVSAVEGRDLAALAMRLGDCVYAVHAALLEMPRG
jgi:hypothetical protein